MMLHIHTIIVMSMPQVTIIGASQSCNKVMLQHLSYLIEDLLWRGTVPGKHALQDPAQFNMMLIVAICLLLV